MRTIELDSLLGDKYPEATFHDSELEAISIDFVANAIRMNFRIPCGLLPDRTLFYQAGMLTFENICYYVIEPVQYDNNANETPTLWITDDGPLPASNVPVPGSDLQGLPDNAFAHYFYSSTTNSFIAIAATNAHFTWK